MNPAHIEAFLTALQQQKIKVAQTLLSDHPELANAQGPQGISLLLMCAYYQQMDLAHLIGAKKRELSLFEATALGKQATIAAILEKEPSALQQPAADGFYLLGFASFFGQLELVKYFLAQGAKVNQAAQNDFKVTPIHSAVAKGSYAITECLLAHGANPNLAQAKGITALHSAAHQSRLDLVKLLVTHGAKVDAQMEDGQTPLSMAKKENATEVIAYLSAQIQK